MKKLIEGCSWSGLSRGVIVALLGLYALCAAAVSLYSAAMVAFLLQSKAWGLVALLCLLVCAYVLLLHETCHVWRYQWMKMPIGILSCWFLYYAVMALVWMLLCLLLKPEIRLSAQVLSGLALLSGIVVVAGCRNAASLSATKYSIALEGREAGCTIALISDLHLGAFVRKGHLRKIVEQVNALCADVVVIAGDLLDDDASALQEDAENFCSELRRLKSREGVFFAVGNHDPSTKDAEFLRFLENAKIRLLDNEAVSLRSITLMGHSDPENNERKPCWEKKDGKPLVVLEHDPRFIPEAEENGADVALCGHTHNGQLFPANLLTKLCSRDHFIYGMRRYGKTTAIISSGAGFFNLPVRLGTRNEVVEVEIL